jgi:hypothetical protein
MQSPMGGILRPNSVGVAFLEKKRLPTHGTLPRVKSKEGEDLSLKQALSMQAPQFAGAIWTLNR